MIILDILGENNISYINEHKKSQLKSDHKQNKINVHYEELQLVLVEPEVKKLLDKNK